MRTDPLERLGSRRVIVVAAVGLAAVAFIGSAASEVPVTLPGVALGSSGLLHLERSLIVGAAVAGALIFLLRGWQGYFPSKLSTNGAEYGVLSVASDAVRNEDDISEALARVERGRHALTDSLREDIRTLERRVDALTHTHLGRPRDSQ
jgi:hypothetical protein